LESDREAPRKQRHTAARIYTRLKEEGYEGRYTAVKEAVREVRRGGQEVYMPLLHLPGEAQADFFEALVEQSGVLRKAHCFVMALPYSDAFLMQAFEREITETFWEGHRRAFEFFGGVPRRITYDNTKIAVRKLVGPHDRQLTQGFLQLQSHYLFSHHFCLVRRANEKGVVEGTGKYARRNFLVPVPKVRDLDELNLVLQESCLSDLTRQLRGKKACKAELLEEEREQFLPLPQAPFDASRKQYSRANSLSLVRFDSNDYSVPVRYAHHDVLVKGYVDRLVICKDGQNIAEHRRTYESGQVVFEPRHYLALLERKPGALDFARPLEQLRLPECFSLLRRKLEGQQGRKGTREYIAVLRLLERHPLDRVKAAVERALHLSYPGRDVIALYLYPDEPREAGFCLAGREHLKGVSVKEPELAGYETLLHSTVRLPEVGG
jgi:transposase